MREWEILHNYECDNVWNVIYERFKFYPDRDSKKDSMDFLELPKPFLVYDMHLFVSYLKDKNFVLTEDYYNNFNNYITKIMIKCLGSDDYLYALNWQHTCFKYNPKSEEKMPRMLEANNYRIYFPDFYPNGDYYLFVAKDFSWGYFTHPWTQQLWVFGNEILEEIEKVPSIYLTLRSRG